MHKSLFAGSALALAALAAALMPAPALAESIASSASSAGSASVGSLSDSIGGSSDASSGRRTADAGTYRVMAVAPLDDGLQRLTLQSEAEPGREFTLTLPVAAASLQPGARIEVQARPYGLAFAHAAAPDAGAPSAPFFLALADDWRHDLDLRRVAL